MFKSDDTGKLILRLALGLLVLLHGLHKLDTGVSGIAGMLEQRGLPGFLAYGAYIGEILGPLLLIIGVYARLGALLVFVNMLMAFALVHANELSSLTRSGGWMPELPGMFLFAALAIMFLGAGRFSLGGSGGRWN